MVDTNGFSGLFAPGGAGAGRVAGAAFTIADRRTLPAPRRILYSVEGVFRFKLY